MSDREEVALGGDPINQLRAIATDMQEQHLGDLLGDLRRAGSEVTRWDFYAAPFRIELTPALRERAGLG